MKGAQDFFGSTNPSFCQCFSIKSSTSELPKSSAPTFDPLTVDGRTMNNSSRLPIETSSEKAQTNSSLIRTAFTSGPFENKARAEFLKWIVGSLFLFTNELEPTLGSDEGQLLLGKVSWISDYPYPCTHLTDASDSIYVFLADIPTRKCLMCGSSKTSLSRAVCCVRSHLDHRPFVCGSSSSGCLSCPLKVR